MVEHEPRLNQSPVTLALARHLSRTIHLLLLPEGVVDDDESSHCNISQAANDQSMGKGMMTRALSTHPACLFLLEQFCTSPAHPVLYVLKYLTVENAPAALDAHVYMDSHLPFYIYLTFDLNRVGQIPHYGGAFAVVKKDPSTPLSSAPASSSLTKSKTSSHHRLSSLKDQLQIIHLPSLAPSPLVSSATVMEGQVNLPAQLEEHHQSTSQMVVSDLFSIMHHSIQPFFAAFVSPSMERASLNAKKKIAECEISLLHLQQAIDIPLVDFDIHPYIANLLVSLREQQGKVRVDLNHLELDQLTDDSSLLNALQSHVNGWIKEIQKVTCLDTAAPFVGASQELNFWLNVERAVTSITERLEQEDVKLSMLVLKNAKRFHATVSFLADTGLEEMRERATKFNLLFRDMPLDDFLSSKTDLGILASSLSHLFAHINKKIRISTYPMARTLQFVESISVELERLIFNIVSPMSILTMDLITFQHVFDSLRHLTLVWDESLKEFINVAREVSRKRSEKFIPIRVTPEHIKLCERLFYLQSFRHSHEQLLDTVQSVHQDSLNRIVKSFNALTMVDYLDISTSGCDHWTVAEKRYMSSIAEVETVLIQLITEALGQCKNSAELFKVFAKFNSLLVRPRIRGALQPTQAVLIQHVEEDILKLQVAFKGGYEISAVAPIDQARNIPSMIGSLIWMKGISRQLQVILDKVKGVFGADLELYPQGQKFVSQVSHFQSKLDMGRVFEAWIEKMQLKDWGWSGPLFTAKVVYAPLLMPNSPGGNSAMSADRKLELCAHFDMGCISFHKQVTHLQWAKVPVPHMIIQVSSTIKRLYPYGVAMHETIKAFQNAINELSNSYCASLVDVSLHEVQQLLLEGASLSWNTVAQQYPGYIERLSESVTQLSTLTSRSRVVQDELDPLLESLRTCRYSQIARVLEQLTRVANRVQLESFHTENWFGVVEGRIQDRLMVRCKEGIDVWVNTFMVASNNLFEKHALSNSSSMENLEEIMHSRDSYDMDEPSLSITLIELRIKQQRLICVPSIGQIRQGLFGDFHAWLDLIGALPLWSDSSKSYASLYASMTNHVAKAYFYIQKTMIAVEEFMDRWNDIMSLWKLKIEPFCALSILDWISVWEDWRNFKSRLEYLSGVDNIGCFSVNSSSASYKIAYKLDALQTELEQAFYRTVARESSVFLETVSLARNRLESLSMTPSNLSFVLELTSAQKLDVKGTLESFEKCQQICLTFNRSKLVGGANDGPNSSDPFSIEQIVGESSSFLQCLAGKADYLFLHKRSFIVSLLNAETNALKSIADIDVKLAELIQASNTIDLTAPLDTDDVYGVRLFQSWLKELGTLEVNVSELGETIRLISLAKAALDLDPFVYSLSSSVKSITETRTVWKSFSSLQESLDKLMSAPFFSASPTVVREQLVSIVGSIDADPKLISLPFAKQFKELVKIALGKVPFVVSLQLPVLADRHWKLISSRLGIPALSSVTLKDLFSLPAGASDVRDIIVRAQGEAILEEFFKGLESTWGSFACKFFPFKSSASKTSEAGSSEGPLAVASVYLIKDWKGLFDILNDHIAELEQAKNSPFYGEFDAKATQWSSTLNSMSILFDVWIQTQKQFVYLEGIFVGNPDIKHTLPVESCRFASLQSDFLHLMRKAYTEQLAWNIVRLPGILSTVESLHTSLNDVKRSLVDYLEKERASFPRFYFVGDEDLLEILGNSNDLTRVIKHLPKIFAGISRIEVSDDKLIAFGCSGESVSLAAPILLSGQSVNQILLSLEAGMKETLKSLVLPAVDEFSTILSDIADRLKDNSELMLLESSAMDIFEKFIRCYPCQIVLLSLRIQFTRWMEASNTSLSGVLRVLLNSITLHDLPVALKGAREQLIGELSYQLSVCDFKDRPVSVLAPALTDWNCRLRFYCSETSGSLVRAEMGMAKLEYGFEYTGVPELLVRTPLTEKCFLTLAQALHFKLGASPFGPAGTGKTETVKGFGVLLARHTLVFCCDESFDSMAMERLFLGICFTGSWGCFDEFNRLPTSILSSISSQLSEIASGLRFSTPISLCSSTSFKVNQNTGIFITMNPGYLGRSSLPDNLKALFKSVAMTKPDQTLIGAVLLSVQGFKNATMLSQKATLMFSLCRKLFSKQSFYDFGLRAFKAVLMSTSRLSKAKEAPTKDLCVLEQHRLVSAIISTILPKLVAIDVPLLNDLLCDVFPGIDPIAMKSEAVMEAIEKISHRRGLVSSPEWMSKIEQLHHLIGISLGVMLVGPCLSGKSVAWNILLEALGTVDGIEGVSHVIDPKAIRKEDLYGVYDSSTKEWQDGLFTSILRSIHENVRGDDKGKRHWIVFDGDVDPDWVENLNSMLDDNRILTLPNGERLSVPENLSILFMVDDLSNATLATVSRCGMIKFHETTLSESMMIQSWIKSLNSSVASMLSPWLFGVVLKALERAKSLPHCMEYNPKRSLLCLFSLFERTLYQLVVTYGTSYADKVPRGVFSKILLRSLFLHCVWSLVGDCVTQIRIDFASFLISMGLGQDDQTGSSFDHQKGSTATLLDCEIDFGTGEWRPVVVPAPHPGASDTLDAVIPTNDTVKYEFLLYTLMNASKPLVLCGPPGSGKTMNLLSALRKMPDRDLLPLNFSTDTTPESLLQSLNLACILNKSAGGYVLTPKSKKWLVVFCDEVNLPAQDKYGCVRVISLIRSLLNHGKYWSSKHASWVTLERIQFVAACNPPTDPGRVPLSSRFLSRCCLLYVDYPDSNSLFQIYSHMMSVILKPFPYLRCHVSTFVSMMLRIYQSSVQKFQGAQPHYVYSPRELSRWVRACKKSLESYSPNLEEFLTAFAFEGSRLFGNRLISQQDWNWTIDLILETVNESRLLGVNDSLSAIPIYSSWLSGSYEPVNLEDLKRFIQARLEIYAQETNDIVDGSFVVYQSLLDHMSRLDSVMDSPRGHALLIGQPGTGKSSLVKFVAWIKGYSLMTLTMSQAYSTNEFEEDIKAVLKKAGFGSKTLFLLDGNLVPSWLLETMNTVLANSEVPGLFQGPSMDALVSEIRDASMTQGVALNPGSEYAWFLENVQNNLHVVITMIPPPQSSDSASSVTPTSHHHSVNYATSPALFNRCVVDWIADWDTSVMLEVVSSKVKPLNVSLPGRDETVTRTSLNSCLVEAHVKLSQYYSSLHSGNVYSSRLFLNTVDTFVSLVQSKQRAHVDNSRHLNDGISKLSAAELQLSVISQSLQEKSVLLKSKTQIANEKLSQMISGQQAAELDRASSLKMKQCMLKLEKEIEEKRLKVEEELAHIEPRLEGAQNSVKNIKKIHLTELRGMAHPPETVKMTMESICILLGNKVDTWRSVVAVLRRDDFIASIVNFDSSSITRSVLLELQPFLQNPAFNFQTVNHASKACGPLVDWVLAQIDYASILERVTPLRLSMQEMMAGGEQTKAQLSEIASTLTKLEAAIVEYEYEYTALMADITLLKNDMSATEQSLRSAVTVLEALKEEKERWEDAVAKDSSSTIFGDSILLSLVVCHFGGFDNDQRAGQLQSLTKLVQSYNIPVETSTSFDLSNLWDADRIFELSKPEFGLPQDSVCIQNAIILSEARYPLIIDPAEKAKMYIQARYPKAAFTSMLDKNFMKSVETCCRFGRTLILSDLESYFDPILYSIIDAVPVIVSGRSCISVAGKWVDYSSGFKMMFYCRTMPLISPCLASRLSLVNFSLTSSSLQRHFLHHFLALERPDIVQRQSDVNQFQRVSESRLLHLERELLSALNHTSGDLLNDAQLLGTLNSLKAEANELRQKLNGMSDSIDLCEQVMAKYDPVASACSDIYFMLQHFHYLEPYYQFTLEYLQKVVFAMFDEPLMKGMSDPESRLGHLKSAVCPAVYNSFIQSFLQQDRPLFGLQLTRVYFDLNGWNTDALDHTIRFSSPVQSVNLTNDQALQDLENLQWCKGISRFLAQNASESAPLELKVQSFIQSSTRELEDCPVKVRAAIIRLLVTQRKFPELIESTLRDVMHHVFADSTRSSTVNMEPYIGIPLVLLSMPGYDPSIAFEYFAEQQGLDVSCVCMGSTESIQEANDLIKKSCHAIKSFAAGGVSGLRKRPLVLLKNAHLCLDWLHSLKLPECLLVLTLEWAPKQSDVCRSICSAPIYQFSTKMVFERPYGMIELFSQSMRLAQQFQQGLKPVDKRMVLALTWLHALLQERSRLAPQGWSKSYEFSDFDFRLALNILDATRAEISWDTAKALFAEVYCSKVDVATDRIAVESLIDRIMVSNEQTIGSALNGIFSSAPEVLEDTADWISSVLEPAFGDHRDVLLSLPSAAEMRYRQRQGLKVMLRSSVLNCQPVNSASVIPARYSNVYASKIAGWLGILPSSLPERGGLNLNGLDQRLGEFMSDEWESLKALFIRVQGELSGLAKLLAESLKSESVLASKWPAEAKALLSNVVQDRVPKAWCKISPLFAHSLLLSEWMADFQTRIKNLCAIDSSGIWLGGLFQPEAYLIINKQLVCRKEKIALEGLSLHLTRYVSDSDRGTLPIRGLLLEYASLCDTQGEEVLMPSAQSNLLVGSDTGGDGVYLVWRRKDEEGDVPSIMNGRTILSIPLYQSEEKRCTLAMVHVSCPSEHYRELVERGVCLLAHCRMDSNISSACG